MKRHIYFSALVLCAALIAGGCASLDTNANDPAIMEYTQAITRDPNNAEAYSNRAKVYYEKGDNNRAIADYSQAITLAPNLAYTYTNRGNAYAKKGDYKRAIADYTQAITLDPNYAEAKQRLAEAEKERNRR
jgi:tetratricopeptide (TPR) repeat protein